MKRTFDVVADYSADNSGSSDTTTAIQNAITAAVAAGPNSAVHFPAGFYNVGSPLSVQADNFTLSGDGVGATVINFTSTSTTQNGFNVGGNGGSRTGNGVSFRDLSLVSAQFGAVSQTTINAQSADNMSGYNSGAAIYFHGSGNFRVQNFAISGFMTGIQLDNPNASQVWVTDGDMANNVLYSVLVTALGGNAFFNNLEISGNSASSNTANSVGIRINRGDGYQIANSLIFGCGKAALVLQPIASTPYLSGSESTNVITYVYCSNTQFDLPYNGNTNDSLPTLGSSVVVDGSLKDSTSVNIAIRLFFSNCSATAASRNGFFFRNCGRIDVTGCKAFANGGYGVRVDSPTSHIRINGGQYFDNGTLDSTPAHDGIFFNQNVTDFSVSDVTCSFTPGEMQRYGVNVSSTGSSRYLIGGCDAFGYSAGAGIHDLGSGNKVVYSNLT